MSVKTLSKLNLNAERYKLIMKGLRMRNKNLLLSAFLSIEHTICGASVGGSKRGGFKDNENIY